MNLRCIVAMYVSHQRAYTLILFVLMLHHE